MQGMAMQRVVIVGGGFGGLNAAVALRKTPVEVTLVDRRNHHLFQPLLYQVATGALSPANIAAPLRALLKRQSNVRVELGEVVDLDVAGRRVVLADGAIGYDTLIVAAGSSHSYFGHPEWEPLAPGLKTIDDATEIRRRVLLAFERAERIRLGADNAEQVGQESHGAVASWLTFVIVGGGPTGVELAGAVAELARYTLVRDFRAIDPRQARILLVEAGDRILAPYTPEQSARAARSLEHFGVKVLDKARVVKVEPESVTVQQGDRTEVIATHTVLWAAGVQASPLGSLLAKAANCHLDRAGRVTVQSDMTLAGHPEIFVIGDMAHLEIEPGKPLPALAPVAEQQGRYAARLISARLRNKPLPPFRYSDWGSMATVGRFQAVADIRGFRFTGFFAWLLWLFVHLMELVAFESRILVLIQWAWHYTTRNRSARLITGEKHK